MTAADVTTMTSAVDFAVIITGIAAIAAALMVPNVARKGAKIILGFMK